MNLCSTFSKIHKETKSTSHKVLNIYELISTPLTFSIFLDDVCNLAICFFL